MPAILSLPCPRLCRDFLPLLRGGGIRRAIAIMGIKFEWQFKYRDESDVNTIASFFAKRAQRRRLRCFSAWRKSLTAPV
jgi:hypothetical protein